MESIPVVQRKLAPVDYELVSHSAFCLEIGGISESGMQDRRDPSRKKNTHASIEVFGNKIFLAG